MKRILILIILVSLAAVAAMGDEVVDFGYHLRTQTVTRAMLQYLGLPESDIEDVLALQYQYRLRAARGTEDIDVLKAKVAGELNSPNANLRRINRWLSNINKIELKQKIARVEVYQFTRRTLGEEQWNKVVGSSVQDPDLASTEIPLQDRDRTTEQLRDGSESGNTVRTTTQTRTGSSDDNNNSSSSPSSNSGNATPAPAKR